MKISKLIFILIFGVILPHWGFGQCANNNTFYTDLTPPGVGQTATSNCTYGGNYNTFYACQGAQYTISTCGSSFNTVVTMYWHATGNYIFYTSSNNCTSNNETFNWTATESGVVRVLIDRGSSCSTSTSCAVMSITQNTPCPDIVTASDCSDAVDVCTNINFYIDPNGFGAINEIPPLGSYSNPDYGHSQYNPWGTLNEGCLRANELNSTWMIVNVQHGGTLEFTFGGLGTQIGYYDWIMYPYDDNSCAAIPNNNLAPIRCNWNGVNWGGTGICNALPSGGDASNYEPVLNVQDNERYIIVFSNWSSVSTNVPLQFYGSATVSCTPLSPLPVELLNFTAETHFQDVHLKWLTATETNNDYFWVERSRDARYWETIETIPGNGNAVTVNAYNTVDRNPGAGMFYYRLSQRDFNGETEMLGVVAVNLESGSWNVYPNPTKLLWQIDSEVLTDDYTINVRDLSGKIVPTESRVLTTSAVVMLKDYRPGIYVLQIIDPAGNNVFNSKLLAE